MLQKQRATWYDNLDGVPRLRIRGTRGSQTRDFRVPGLDLPVMERRERPRELTPEGKQAQDFTMDGEETASEFKPWQRACGRKCILWTKTRERGAVAQIPLGEI